MTSLRDADEDNGDAVAHRAAGVAEWGWPAGKCAGRGGII